MVFSLIVLSAAQHLDIDPRAERGPGLESGHKATRIHAARNACRRWRRISHVHCALCWAHRLSKQGDVDGIILPVPCAIKTIAFAESLWRIHYSHTTIRNNYPVKFRHNFLPIIDNKIFPVF